MSPATATALEPAVVISSMTSEASSAAAMSLTTTVAPARAKPIASARPRPAAAPVTTATFPDRSAEFVLLLNFMNTSSLRVPGLLVGIRGSAARPPLPDQPEPDRSLRPHSPHHRGRRYPARFPSTLRCLHTGRARLSPARRPPRTGLSIRYAHHTTRPGCVPGERSLDPQTRTCYNQGGEWVAVDAGCRTTHPRLEGGRNAHQLHPGAGGAASRAAVVLHQADHPGAP